MLDTFLHIIGFCPDTLGHFDLLDIIFQLQVVASLNWTYYKCWFEIYFRRF